MSELIPFLEKVFLDILVFCSLSFSITVAQIIGVFIAGLVIGINITFSRK